ncbi:uncharacterized protein LOC122153524 [Tyto alba]|uniref:uncharacterized protein LOC122153524 n=1 Tax=Tyto alba TaxID=56313 RepID=UPI001C669CC4|nr:uncharacterized protein LOC122153524 [Tyto alba]
MRDKVKKEKPRGFSARCSGCAGAAGGSLPLPEPPELGVPPHAPAQSGEREPSRHAASQRSARNDNNVNKGDGMVRGRACRLQQLIEKYRGKFIRRRLRPRPRSRALRACSAPLPPTAAQVVSPLNQVRREKNDFTWGPEQQGAFEQTKQEIVQALALGPVRQDKMLEMCSTPQAGNGPTWRFWQRAPGETRGLTPGLLESGIQRIRAPLKRRYQQRMRGFELLQRWLVRKQSSSWHPQGRRWAGWSEGGSPQHPVELVPLLGSCCLPRCSVLDLRPSLSPTRTFSCLWRLQHLLPGTGGLWSPQHPGDGVPEGSSLWSSTHQPGSI